MVKGIDITITREGDQLYGQLTHGPKAAIIPKSENEFYLEAINAQISFNKNEKTVTLYQDGKTIVGRKKN